MVKLKKLTTHISSLPGYKIILLLLIIGVILMVIGKYLPSATTTTTDSGTINRTEQEQKLAEIISEMEGVGDVEVVIYTKDKTSSVLVLATGADDPNVQIKIRQAVRTLLQTDNKNIKIVKKQS